MRKLTTILLLTLTTCTPPPNPGDPFDIPLEVRIACSGGTDAWITSWLAFIEADRQAGVTYSSEIYEFSEFCLDYDIGCNACFTAMVNHVYGVNP